MEFVGRIGTRSAPAYGRTWKPVTTFEVFDLFNQKKALQSTYYDRGYFQSILTYLLLSILIYLLSIVLLSQVKMQTKLIIRHIKIKNIRNDTQPFCTVH